MNNRRIIIPNKMNSQLQNLKQPTTQIPIFPIPVQSNESYLLYALCIYVLETGVYDDMPNILPQLTAMKQGLEMAYTKLGIPLYEYRGFVVAVKDTEGLVALTPKEAKEDIEKCLVGSTKNSEWVSNQQKEGEEKNVEMGKEPEKEE